MAYRRKPKETNRDPQRQEFTFTTGSKQPPAPSPVAARRPPKRRAK